MNPPQPNVYDPANAARLCQASRQAYASDPGRTCRVVASVKTDTRALLLDDGADFIVAFRGTQDLRNWLTDLDCRFAPASFGRVQAGFVAALNTVYAELAEAIFDAHCAGKRIWLTGHSLGGALAMLAARQLIKPLAGCYTFGQPRVGDAAYCAAYDALLRDRTFRVVHDADVVTRVPWLLGSYRHAGHEVFYPASQITNDKFSMAPGGCVKPIVLTTNCQFQNREIENWQLKICYWQLDPSFFAKLPYDVRALAGELLNGKLALLHDHHIVTYLALIGSAPVGVSAFSLQPFP